MKLELRKTPLKEKFGNMTREEVMQGFVDLQIKRVEIEAAYEAHRLKLFKMLADPNLTDDQRQEVRAALKEIAKQ